MITCKIISVYFHHFIKLTQSTFSGKQRLCSTRSSEVLEALIQDREDNKTAPGGSIKCKMMWKHQA